MSHGALPDEVCHHVALNISEEIAACISCGMSVREMVKEAAIYAENKGRLEFADELTKDLEERKWYEAAKWVRDMAVKK